MRSMHYDVPTKDARLRMVEFTEMLCDRVPLNKREAHEMARSCRIPASAVLPIAIGAEGWDATKTGGMTPRNRQTRDRYGLDAPPCGTDPGRQPSGSRAHSRHTTFMSRFASALRS